MSVSYSNNSKTKKLSNDIMDGSNYRFLIIYSDINLKYVKKLTDLTCEQLYKNYNVKKENIFQYPISDIYEFPYTAYHMIDAAIKHEAKPFNAVICIGIVPSSTTTTNQPKRLGDISNSISQGLIKINIKLNTPIIHGIFVDDINKGNAESIRNQIDSGNLKDIHLAKVAVEMAKIHSIKGIPYYYSYKIKKKKMCSSSNFY